MDRGKRAMTDAELEDDRRARRPRTTSDDNLYLQPYSQVDSSYDLVYRGLTPYTVRPPVVAARPPFVAEEQNVENIVVDQSKLKSISQIRSSMSEPKKITCRCEASIGHFVSLDFYDICLKCSTMVKNDWKCKNCGYLGEPFMMSIVRLEIYDQTSSAWALVSATPIEDRTEKEIIERFSAMRYVPAEDPFFYPVYRRCRYSFARAYGRG